MDGARISRVAREHPADHEDQGVAREPGWELQSGSDGVGTARARELRSALNAAGLLDALKRERDVAGRGEAPLAHGEKGGKLLRGVKQRRRRQALREVTQRRLTELLCCRRKSSTSSTSWNARPRFLPYSYAAAWTAVPCPASAAAAWAALAMSEAVL